MSRDLILVRLILVYSLPFTGMQLGSLEYLLQSVSMASAIAVYRLMCREIITRRNIKSCDCTGDNSGA